MENESRQRRRAHVLSAAVGLIAVGAAVLLVNASGTPGPGELAAAQVPPAAQETVVAPALAPAAESPRRLVFQPRQRIDTGGFLEIVDHLRRWPADASLEQIRDIWQAAGPRTIRDLDRILPPQGKSDSLRLKILLSKISIFNYEGETDRAYELLGRDAGLGREERHAGRARALHVDFFPGRDRPAAAARPKTASCAGAKARASSRSCPPPSTPTRPALGWRSAISPSISSSSPTTSGSAGCSTWPT